MSQSKKLIGHCTCCDKAVFDIVEVYPHDHPYAGEPRKIGNPHDDALRVTVILTDGKHIDVTICSYCFRSGDFSYNDIWDSIKSAWALEVSDEHCKILQKPVYTPEQRSNMKKWLDPLCDQGILGTLCVRKWRDVADA